MCVCDSSHHTHTHSHSTEKAAFLSQRTNFFLHLSSARAAYCLKFEKMRTINLRAFPPQNAAKSAYLRAQRIGKLYCSKADKAAQTSSVPLALTSLFSCLSLLLLLLLIHSFCEFARVWGGKSLLRLYVASKRTASNALFKLRAVPNKHSTVQHSAESKCDSKWPTHNKNTLQA